MQLILHPSTDQWPSLLQRPVYEPEQLEKAIRKVLLKVKTGGDKAVRKFTREFDGV
jgi:histidinol dehydrogenase